MKATILIPYCTRFESDILQYSLWQINKFRHPEIEQEIIIADQAPRDISQDFEVKIGTLPAEVQREIKLIRIPRVDAGYPINVGAQNATGDYFCSLDADAFPIHKNWLYAPVKTIEKYGLAFVGKQTGLHTAYAHEGNFFHINNYFRVSFTRTAKRCAEEVGFMRYEHRDKAMFRPSVQTRWKTHCDNGVVAQWYSDAAKMGGKLSLALNRCVGTTSEMGLFGMIIDDLVFHLVFGFGEQWISDQEKTLGPEYLWWKRRMEENLAQTLDEMVATAAPKYSHFTDREYWDMEKYLSLSKEDQMWQDFETWKNS